MTDLPWDEQIMGWSSRQIHGSNSGAIRALMEQVQPDLVPDNLVLARTHAEFTEWCHRHNLSPNGRRTRHITSSYRLRGYAPGSVRVIELPDWDEGWRPSEVWDVERFLETLEDDMKVKVAPDFRAKPLILPDRIPLSVEIETGFAMGGRPATRRVTQFLDGGHLQESFVTRDYSDYYATETDMPDAVSSRTDNIADFGRIKIAAAKLATQMSSYSSANPPSPEQLTIFVRSYQNMVRWRTAVLAQMEMADGQMGTVKGMLDRWLD